MGGQRRVFPLAEVNGHDWRQGDELHGPCNAADLKSDSAKEDGR